ncbi:MAG TPA: hypothetical protein VNU46_06020, partial [Gemmatimonadaceae bacterium]|nr:hypothetical protein [Gemmatimonadaceae bacterium]
MTRRYQNILLLNASATGAGTAITGDDRETSTAIFAVTITGTATITFQGSADGGVTTYSIPVTSVTASPVTSTTVTASGIYRCDATGISVFPNVTSYSSGAVTVVGSLERGTLAGGIASGGGGGGGAITMASGAVASGAYVSGSIADGAIVTIGTEADTANTTASTSGTLMAFLKGAVKVLADVWNGTLHYLNVAVTDGTHLLPTMDAAARAG